MGHFCRICGRTRANEKFSGRGHRDHVCKDCQRLPREKRDRIEHLDELWGFLDQRNISAKNIARLKTLVVHPDLEVQKLAALVLDVALVHPFKRRRWRHLAARHRDLFDQAVVVLGPEFFDDVLQDYGDTGGPLWDALEERRFTSQAASDSSFPPIDSDGDDRRLANQPAVCHKPPGSLR